MAHVRKRSCEASRIKRLDLPLMRRVVQVSCPENVGGYHIYRYKNGRFECRCGKVQTYDSVAKDWK